MPLSRCSALLLLLAGGTLVPAADLLLDAGLDATAWRFHDGGEFPGAKGGLTPPAPETSGVALRYDFSGGGMYVSADFTAGLPPALDTLRWDVSCDQAVKISFRVRDAAGRTFQSQPRAVAAGVAAPLELGLAGPWAEAWDGDAQQAAPSTAVACSLIVGRNDDTPPTGVVTIRSLSAVSHAAAADLAEPVATAPFNADLAGWKLSGTWIAQWHRPVLALTASSGSEAGELSFTLPRPARDWTLRRALVPGQPVHLRVVPPVADGGNPHAIYRLACAVRTASGKAEHGVALKGRLADAALLGAPRLTRDLPPSIFGTAMHLSYGGNGAFAGWAQSDRLLDEVAALGLSWIRDGVGVDQAADGTLTLSAKDLAWLTAAKARGIRVIAVLSMDAKTPVADLCARATAIATQGAGLIDAIELGNEPNNFGGWIKAYGGTWNGMVSNDDHTTAPWVTAHLAASNAAAEAIKKVAPHLTVLALGSPSPVNARAIDLGLSPAVDGIVDHPYAMCTPPETIPFGKPYAKRDGIAPGDEACTFAGLVEWYRARFAQDHRTVPLWVTEFGWTTFRHDLKNPSGLFAGFTEETQAAYLVRRHLQGAWLGLGASVQYDLLDDYGSQTHEGEANFGLLRSDYSRKPAWYATQRLCSLFAGAVRDSAADVTITAAPLHRAQQRGDLVHNWDGVALRPQEAVFALPFSHPDHPELKTLAVWSGLPPSEFNGRRATLRLRGWEGYGQPVCIGLCSGRITDPQVTRDGDGVVLTLDLDDEPVALRFFQQ
jgi:hypothetical protein